MKKLTVLVDMDDVLDELLQHWMASLNSEFGTNVRCEEIYQWEIKQYFPNLTESQIFAPLKTEEFWSNMTAVDGAREYLEKMQQDGHRIYIVTATHYGTAKPKIKWLLKAFPTINWSDVIITSQKHLIKGDVLIDDGVHNLVDGTYDKILFNRPHNYAFNEQDIGAIRANSWADVYDAVYKLSQSGGDN